MTEHFSNPSNSNKQRDYFEWKSLYKQGENQVALSCIEVAQLIIIDYSGLVSLLCLVIKALSNEHQLKFSHVEGRLGDDRNLNHDSFSLEYSGILSHLKNHNRINIERKQHFCLHSLICRAPWLSLQGNINAVNISQLE